MSVIPSRDIFTDIPDNPEPEDLDSHMSMTETPTFTSFSMGKKM